VEYNKIEINESGDQCFIQNTEIETVMCCLMKQKLINSEYKQYLEGY
jgi:hypothetical protein